MKKINIFIAIILLASFVPGFAQVYVEPVFGIRRAPYRLGYIFEEQSWNVPSVASIFKPSDCEELRFINNSDTTDIILLTDSGKGVLRWLRCSNQNGIRRLEFNGVFGLNGWRRNVFQSPEAIAVASIQPLYNPDTDHIFIADMLNNCITKLNFYFDNSNPASDRIVCEDTIRVDSSFYPIDIEYINFETGNRRDNRIIALDHNGHRLFLFSDEGTLINEFDMSEYEDSISSVYHAFTHRVLSSDTVAIYLVDISSGGIRMFHLNSDSELEDIACLLLGDRLEIQVTDVTYSEHIGLWAVESFEPAFFKLAEDLSHIIARISIPEYDLESLINPQKIIPLPNRVVILESADMHTGIVSFAFSPYRGKEVSQKDEEPLPFQFALNQNYPNPLNPYTTIKYEIPFDGHVNIEVFNILGQKVCTLVDESKSAGRYSVLWKGLNKSGRSVASGVYFYRLKSKEYTSIKKMTVLK